jgi:membrane-associated phospholipid phosphatase
MHYRPEWPVLLERSFPSGHSEGAFSFLCFLSLLLPYRYNKLGILFFLLALTVCYSRIYLAAHFFEDVYAGSIIGTVATTLIFSFMVRYKKQN